MINILSLQTKGQKPAEKDFKRHGKLQVDPQLICGLCDSITISKIIFQKNVSIQTTHALLGQWPLTSQTYFM